MNLLSKLTPRIIISCVIGLILLSLLCFFTIDKLSSSGQVTAFNATIEEPNLDDKVLVSYNEANKLLEAKNYFEASDKFKKALVENGGDFKEAIQGLDNCLKLMYDDFLVKADAFELEYKYKEAAELLKKVITYFPKDITLTKKLSDYQKLLDSYNNLVVYTGQVEHVFFHPLIAYTELAFDGDNMSLGYNEWMTTVTEFNRMLEEMYKRNFILVDINSLFEEKEENGQTVVVKKDLFLPPGKKPFIISIDDMNYYPYMHENGNVYKLVLDDKGNVATYSLNLKKEPVISHDNEIVPILDTFVKNHPDFSFNGAKAVIALTGYEGVLGYRTDNLDDPQLENDRAEVSKVIKRLKETGWTFASHSYGHPDLGKTSYERLVKDTTQWIDEVQLLTGPTKILIYPFGSSVKPHDPKFKYLYDHGFRFFCAVGNTSYIKYNPTFVAMDRRHLDGYALMLQPKSLEDLFDPAAVVDSARPPLPDPNKDKTPKQ